MSYRTNAKPPHVPTIRELTWYNWVTLVLAAVGIVALAHTFYSVVVYNSKPVPCRDETFDRRGMCDFPEARMRPVGDRVICECPREVTRE